MSPLGRAQRPAPVESTTHSTVARQSGMRFQCTPGRQLNMCGMCSVLHACATILPLTMGILPGPLHYAGQAQGRCTAPQPSSQWMDTARCNTTKNAWCHHAPWNANASTTAFCQVQVQTLAYCLRWHAHGLHYCSAVHHAWLSLTPKAARMMTPYEVPSTTVTGRCGILSVMALIFSSVSSKESTTCFSKGRAGDGLGSGCWMSPCMMHDACSLTRKSISS